MTKPHIADAEQAFFVMAVTPDMCKVGNSIVAFKPFQFLPPEEQAYSTSVFARGEKVLMVKSIIADVMGNAGKGLKSEVSLMAASSKVTEGSHSVLIEGRRVARDWDEVDMNVKVM
jgi:uncharacterized Zn-binding protein involved in type VI secretion